MIQVYVFRCFFVSIFIAIFRNYEINVYTRRYIQYSTAYFELNFVITV